jgi:hypothetical protein
MYLGLRELVSFPKRTLIYRRSVHNTKAKKAKSVPLHAMKLLGGRIGVATTH